MKILITADLHGQWSWYEWLSRQQVGLVVIAGDLIDMLACDEREIDHCVAFLASFKSPVAVCSGNHDNPSGWFPRLEALGILTDGNSRMIGDILVTSLPYQEADPGDNDALLHEAQKAVGRKRWMVLHHNPPCGSPVGGSHASMQILHQIRKIRPDYLASGHWHHQPYLGSWHCKVGPTVCLNAGQGEPSAGKPPNYIFLDTQRRLAVWVNTVKNRPTIEHVQLDKP